MEWRHGCAGLGFPATAVARGRGDAERDDEAGRGADDARRFDGNVRFNLTDGEYTLIVTHAGYKKFSKKYQFVSKVEKLTIKIENAL